MTLWTIDIIDETTGKFTFVNKSGWQEDVLFSILKLSDQWELAQKHFAQFGFAKPEFENWKKMKDGQWLVIDEAILNNHNDAPWYAESILLHEMMDFDDHELSMLESEQYVMDQIKQWDLSEEQKVKLITKHVWFFEGCKNFYEELLWILQEGLNKPEENKDNYEKREAAYAKNSHHLKKINWVITYLTTLLPQDAQGISLE